MGKIGDQNFDDEQDFLDHQQGLPQREAIQNEVMSSAAAQNVS